MIGLGTYLATVVVAVLIAFALGIFVERDRKP
mgnify:CR=1 FL=1